MDQNFLDLLQCFEEQKVKYLIIGGYAVSFHAEPRYTKDIDIWVECSKANSKKVYKALESFGAPMASITADDFAIEGNAFTAGLPPLRFDILTRVKGVDFKTAYKSKIRIKSKKTYINYIGIKDLAKTKKAAGRPQDIVDYKKLLGLLNKAIK